MLGTLLRPISLASRGLWKASKIETHLTADEKEMLFQLARQSNGRAVEVGSYLGASSCFLAAGLSGKPNATLSCVDTWQNDAMTEGARDTYAAFLANTKRYQQTIRALRGTSQDVARSYSGTIDILFLDADHSYEGVKGDWDAWSPHLADNATVVFHDSGWAEGVKRVIQEDIKPISEFDACLPNMHWATVNACTKGER
ncbi:class I SAM-dependent methyltransferase [Rhodopirellula sallentina]|uniref:Class I SAM-dependent methyltransferase n=1 Tax=Rhodopirellula sallentina SM41 TaxID=1263870 RepID=M5TZS7_9BACT|nr:class I SAM-dependent methyltransferase [Rhodopirellula sallentina]EMI54707.1 hypothetical protein RSSM_03823 [Rhodopirellula sallentina SM41]